ncbi:MAG: hypothetical protein IT374_26270 [Polyangiaceae bacterium]|nr:hypothetical protein [Polyangiaceae bacterium]
MTRIDIVRAELARLNAERAALAAQIRPLAEELSALERIERAASAAGMTPAQLIEHIGTTVGAGPLSSRASVNGRG